MGSSLAEARSSTAPSPVRSSQKSSSESPQERSAQPVRWEQLAAVVVSAMVPQAGWLAATPPERRKRPRRPSPSRHSLTLPRGP